MLRPRLWYLAALSAAASSLVALPAWGGVPYRQWIGDPDGLRSWNEVHEELHELADAYPELARLETIGRTAEGRPLYALRIASDPEDLTRPCIFLVAGHHANEPATPEHVMDAARTMLWQSHREPYATWLSEMALVAVPMVNPDGSHAFWEIDRRLGRKNRRRVSDRQTNIGVDLNRNYPFQWGITARKTSRDPDRVFYRGPEPASEPEVRAMLGLAFRSPPAGLITYHSAATSLLVPYTIDGVPNPEPSAAWSVAHEIVAKLPHTFDTGRRFVAKDGLYPVSGVEKDWYHHEFGTLAYLMELPYRRPRGAALVESIEHTRAAWHVLFERWLAGPSLSVRAIDRNGVPVHAAVSVDQIVTRAGEQFRTHPMHGWYHTYLPEPGLYTVRLKTRGIEIAREVHVHSWTRVEITVDGFGPIASR